LILQESIVHYKVNYILYKIHSDKQHKIYVILGAIVW